MVDRVSFSNLEQDLGAIAFHHENLQISLYEFFSGESAKLAERFPFEKREDARDESLDEIELSSSMSVMSALEAAIRVDYLSRVYGRFRDPLSRSMRQLHNEKKNKAKIDADLMRIWREESNVSRPLINDVIMAFKYRHWLAHGRYWTPKFGRIYDYASLYEIAENFISAMDQYGEND